MKHKLFRFLCSALLIALMLAALGPVRPAYAASYTVNSTADDTNDDGSCTLREAIMAANNAPANANCGAGSSGPDTITFSVSGTITLGSTLPAIVNAATAGTLTIDGTGQTITIDGDNTYRVMIVDSGADLTLRNLTIASGSAILGGGIRNDGTLTVTNSTFSGNSATNFGGGIYNFGALTVTNSTFQNNSTTVGSGGGIYNAGGTLTVTGSTFSANSATFGFGGGIYVLSGSATLKNTIIANSTGGGDCVTAVPLSGSNINNLIEDTGASACGLTSSGGNIIGQDPQLASTPTGSPAYFPLLAGSPAIDAGDNTTCQNPPVNNQSQNGVTRPKDGDLNGTAICDIGSYEVPVFYLFLPLIMKN